MASDRVCLSPNTSCLNDFKMLSVIQTNELGGLAADGILGLAPSAQKTQASLFIEELFNAGLIEKKMFSLYLAPIGG